MNTWSQRIGPCLTPIIAALAFSGCGGEVEQPEPLLRPVRYQPVYATGGARVRSFSGVAEAGIESTLSFKVGGSISRLAVKVGDSVRTGSVIAELDATDYELRMEQAEASLAQARAQARRARADYERTRGLYESRNVSKNDLDLARSGAESADAQVNALEKTLELARQQQAYCRLVAPARGAIAAVPVEVNENVQPGQMIAVLASGANLKVAVGVPEMLISQVREGESVQVAFDALRGRKLAARVTEVGVASSGVVTTFTVTVLLSEVHTDVRPGMAAEVEFSFPASDTRERFVVPPFAVGEDREGRFLFVVNPAQDGFGTVERRTVTVGEFTSDGLEVYTGLVEGDLLVTAGVTKLTDGQRVRLPGLEAATP